MIRGRIVGSLLFVFLGVYWPSRSTVDCRPIALTAPEPSGRHQLLPIIFLPGKGGNQIDAKVDRTALPDEGLPQCDRRLDRYRMWMDLWTFFKHGVDCWSENTHLSFDAATRQYFNFPGVETWIPGWGTTDTMEYVDPSWTAWALGNVGVYARYLVDALVESGYVRGVSLRGAPYDFRYAPHSQAFYFTRLRQLVEETWALNGRRRVVLLAHSMGGLYAAYFLARQPADWKDRYVEALITVNTPWAGTVVAVKMQAAGYNWEIDAVDRLVVRDQQRSFESTVLLLPRTSTYNGSAVWMPSDVVLSTPARNYTVSDYPQLFRDIGYPEGRLKVEAIEEAGYDDMLERNLGVAIHCLYSGGIATPQRLVYDSAATFPDSQPIVEMGDGDGTVNLRSLEACGRWRHVQRAHPVNLTYYDDVQHNKLLHHHQMITDVLRVARRIQ